ncbi:hypothetical protein [Acidipila rosea]|uniref:Uncharacterized protein n=1 Tax=Acidipila rosea TaxID=768535 RepID=A0A4R1L3K5_9BACT|nr:hypothetical protein [Acidipila rosea]TCK71610.1 hypothetical protein C7378_2892 [Acidipila rosea]
MLDHPEFQSEEDPPNARGDESADKDGKSPVSISPISSHPQPPPTPPGSAQPAKEPSKWRDNVKLGIELLGLAALIVYTVFSILQWAQIRWTNRLTREALNGSDYTLQETLKKMQAQTDATNHLYGEAQKQTAQATILANNSAKQAAAATNIAGLTAKQFDQNQRLIESQRASIDVSFLHVLNPVTFSDLGGMSAAFSLAFKNDGSLPANLTAVRYKVIFVQWGDDLFKSPAQKQSELCARPPTADESRIVGVPTTIYKDSALEWQINFGTGRPTDSEIIKWPPPQRGDASPIVQTLRVYPVVVGCVDYQSGAMQNGHQTGFIYTIERVGENGPTMPTLINFGMNVPRESVVVSRYFFSQGKTY